MHRIIVWASFATLVALAVGCDSKPAETDQAAESGRAEQAVDQSGDQSGEEATSQADIPADQTLEGETEGGNFWVVITPDPNPIPFQELFELEVEVYEGEDKKTLAKGVEVDQVRAVMPAHGHGMKNAPRVEKTGEGTFKVEGMRFHMQGEAEHGLWVVEVVLNQGGTIDQTKFDVQCCRD